MSLSEVSSFVRRKDKPVTNRLRTNDKESPGSSHSESSAVLQKAPHD